MAILSGDLLETFMHGCLEDHMAVLLGDFIAALMHVCFGEYVATFSDPKDHMGWFPYMCFATLMRYRFCKHIAILSGDLLSTFMQGCPEEHMAMLPGNIFATLMRVCFGEYMATFSDSEDHMRWSPGKCFVTLMRGRFDEYMATFSGKLYARLPRIAYGDVARQLSLQL